MIKLEDIIGLARDASGLTDPEQIALLSRVITSTAELTVRAAAGENVDEDAAILRATALNLSEHTRNVIGRNVLAYVQEMVSMLLTKVLVA